MNSILFWLGALVVVSVLSPVLRIVIAAVGGKQIGAAALAQQPDRIHLQRTGPQAWRNAGAATKLSDAFLSRGFEDAGIHSVAEMPGLVIQLLAHYGDSFYAAIYQHPKAGTWYDVISQYEDGTSVTYTTARPTALKQRPGHPTVNLPGADPARVLDKALGQRPRRPLKQATAALAADVFENAYADSIAYRKQAGISTGEVVGTAMRKAA
jgi:hypothetical protein